MPHSSKTSIDENVYENSSCRCINWNAPPQDDGHCHGSANQRKQIRPLLQEHHHRIQALLDNNPALSRQDLHPQIHAVCDETHDGLLLSPRQNERKALDRATEGFSSRSVRN
jgi:hypothetical protein